MSMLRQVVSVDALGTQLESVDTLATQVKLVQTGTKLMQACTSLSANLH